MSPHFEAVRLWTRAPHAATPTVPFARTWSPDAQAIAVLLEGTADSLDQASYIAEQIPEARTLRACTPVIVLGTSARAAHIWRRLVGPREVKIARAPRCEALLGLGYVNIGASLDGARGQGAVWGYVPDRRNALV